MKVYCVTDTLRYRGDGSFKPIFLGIINNRQCGTTNRAGSIPLTWWP